MRTTLSLVGNCVAGGLLFLLSGASSNAANANPAQSPVVSRWTTPAISEQRSRYRPGNVTFPTCAGVGSPSFIGVIGENNVADAIAGAVLGGVLNDVCSGDSGIGAGYNNKIGSGYGSFIAGGQDNVINYGSMDFIGAGWANSAAGEGAFVGAGNYNVASGNGSFVGAGDDV